jgi:hypothetical protein
MSNPTDKNNNAMVSDEEFEKLKGVVKGMGKSSNTMEDLHENAKANSGSVDEILSKFEKNQLRRQGGSNAESTQEPTPNNETNKKGTGDTEGASEDIF